MSFANCPICGEYWVSHLTACNPARVRSFAASICSESSSNAVLERIAQLEKECIELVKILEKHKQWVASYAMDDAINGLHKTQGVWNKSITW